MTLYDIGRLNWENNYFTKNEFITSLTPYIYDCKEFLTKIGFENISYYYHPKINMIVFRGLHETDEINKLFKSDNSAFPKVPLTRNIVVFSIYENKLLVDLKHPCGKDNYVYSHDAIVHSLEDYIHNKNLVHIPIYHTYNPSYKVRDSACGNIDISTNALVIKEYDTNQYEITKPINDMRRIAYKHDIIYKYKMLKNDYKRQIEHIERLDKDKKDTTNKMLIIKSKMDSLKEDFYTTFNEKLMQYTDGHNGDSS